MPGILRSHVVDGFCLATSDSDYTRLAIRLKESGAFVMGLGREKTPKSLKSACDVFVLTENLAPPPEHDGGSQQTGVETRLEPEILANI